MPIRTAVTPRPSTSYDPKTDPMVEMGYRRKRSWSGQYTYERPSALRRAFERVSNAASDFLFGVKQDFDFGGGVYVSNPEILATALLPVPGMAATTSRAGKAAPALARGARALYEKKKAALEKTVTTAMDIIRDKSYSHEAKRQAAVLVTKTWKKLGTLAFDISESERIRDLYSRVDPVGRVVQRTEGGPAKKGVTDLYKAVRAAGGHVPWGRRIIEKAVSPWTVSGAVMTAAIGVGSAAYRAGVHESERRAVARRREESDTGVESWTRKIPQLAAATSDAAQIRADYGAARRVLEDLARAGTNISPEVAASVRARVGEFARGLYDSATLAPARAKIATDSASMIGVIDAAATRGRLDLRNQDGSSFDYPDWSKRDNRDDRQILQVYETRVPLDIRLQHAMDVAEGVE